MIMMKKIILSILILPFILGGCSTLRVSSDYDREIDFSLYNTYNFTKKVEDLPINQLNKNRLIDAISREMEAEGFSKSDNPDILLDINVLIDKKRNATTYTDHFGGGFYTYPYPYRWGGGFTTTQVYVNEYLEGTVFIDFIDIKENQLIWQGRGVGTLEPEATNKEERINRAVKKIFSLYPPKW